MLESLALLNPETLMVIRTMKLIIILVTWRYLMLIKTSNLKLVPWVFWDLL